MVGYCVFLQWLKWKGESTNESRICDMSFRVKEEYQSVVSVKSEYAVYDPVKDEETEEEEGDDTITYLPTRYRAYSC